MAEQHRADKHSDKHAERKLIHHGLFPELYDGVENEHAYRNTDARKRILHGGDVGKIAQQRRNNGDDHERWRNDAERGKDRAGELFLLEADKRRSVDRNDAGRALTDGEIVQKLFLRGPVFLFHDLALQKRQHGVAAAEGEQPDPEKRAEQIQKQGQGNDPLSKYLYRTHYSKAFSRWQYAKAMVKCLRVIDLDNTV